MLVALSPSSGVLRRKGNPSWARGMASPAPWVVHRTVTRQAYSLKLGGSSPSPTIAELAQWIEQRFCKAKVNGSNPLFGLIS